MLFMNSLFQPPRLVLDLPGNNAEAEGGEGRGRRLWERPASWVKALFFLLVFPPS